MPLFKKPTVNGRPIVQLSDVHLRVLRRCRMILIKDLKPFDILDCFTAEDGFKQDVKDSILALWSPEKQVGAILDHLETQSDETFRVFMDILREQYKHLHRVLEETARTLDETEDDQARERAAIVGDSVRKLLRHTARRQMQDQLRRGSNDSPGDYYIDNLRNDGDDAGQYIDCYIIPTRGKLQKEKWIKHVASPSPTSLTKETSENVRSVAPASSELILARDLCFRLINQSEIPEGIEQPPKACTCIYVLKREPKVETPKEPEKQEAALERKVSDSRGVAVNQKWMKSGPPDRPSQVPPPLPPKPDILGLGGKNLGRNSSSSAAPKGSSSDEKTKESPVVKIILTPPLPMRKPHDKSEKSNGNFNKETCPLPLTPEKRVNGVLGNTESSEDDDDEDDAVSLNFDVKIDDTDDPYDPVCPNEHTDRTTRTSSGRGSDVTLVGSHLNNNNLSPVSDRSRNALPLTPTVDNISLSGSNALRSFSNSSNGIGLDHSIPVDILSTIEGSHYEEIEPRGGTLTLSSGLYLDPRSDGYTFDRRGSRYRSHRTGTLNYQVNQMKTLGPQKETTLAKGTFLIVKRKDKIVSQNPDFGNTLLGYDHMGHAYYVPIDATKRYGDPRNEKWFYPIEMTAREATLFLSSVNQKGSFVVYQPSKRCESSPLYCLSVGLGSGDVVHYNIVENIHGDVMIQDHDHSFMNVCDLVEYFSRNQSSLATRLRRPLKEASLPIMPGYHYSSRFEIVRHEVALSSIVIDKGTFGDYHLATFKGISVQVSVMTAEASATNDDDFLEEALTMMATEHENVIRFLGVSCRSRPFYIVMEHIDRGTLAECLQHNFIPSDNIDSLFAICIQLVSAMQYLESLSFVLHRNLSTQSFFVTADFLVKLGKFDRARHVIDDNYQATSTEEIMVRWAAPEVLTSSTYSTKSDVWSLGVVLWEVFSQGACPYTSLGIEQVALYVTEGGKLDKPPGCAPDLWSMMKSCWKLSANDRPTFAMLQDKIKGKSSIYYVSPVRNSHMSNKNLAVPELTKHNGGMPAKNKSSSQLKLTASANSVPLNVRKKRSQSASRETHNRIDRDGKSTHGKRANSAVRNGFERARTPSSDSSSIISASIMNDSCDELDRSHKARKSWKKVLKS